MGIAEVQGLAALLPIEKRQPAFMQYHVKCSAGQLKRKLCQKEQH